MAIAALKEDDPRLVLRDAIRRREEIESHINSLKRDAEGIKRNMQQVNAKLARSAGGKDNKDNTHRCAQQQTSTPTPNPTP